MSARAKLYATIKGAQAINAESRTELSKLNPNDTEGIEHIVQDANERMKRLRRELSTIVTGNKALSTMKQRIGFGLDNYVKFFEAVLKGNYEQAEAHRKRASEHLSL